MALLSIDGLFVLNVMVLVALEIREIRHAARMYFQARGRGERVPVRAVRVLHHREPGPKIEIRTVQTIRLRMLFPVLHQRTYNVPQ